MTAVRDLMSTDLTAVSSELTLRDLVTLLDDRHISGAPVVAGGKVLGVITASDVLGFEAMTPAVPRGRGDEPDWELERAAEWEEGSEAPGAFFSDWWAETGADLVARFENVATPEWDVLAEHTVGEAMTRSVCSIQPGTTINEAAAYMIRAGIHRLLVLEDGKLVGLITTTDIVRALAEGRF